MADVCDLAEKEIDAALALQIATARRSRSLAAPIPGAECLNECGDTAQAGSHFCSHECCENFSYREKTMKKQRAK